MQLDQNPSFRRIIPPWYDADVLCYAVVVFAATVCLFGLAGIFTATQTLCAGCLWVPLALTAMGLWVLASTCLRLVRRRRRKGN